MDIAGQQPPFFGIQNEWQASSSISQNQTKNRTRFCKSAGGAPELKPGVKRSGTPGT